MNVRRVIILLLLATAHRAVAQHAAPAKDTILKGSSIEVIQAYKPEIKQAPKPEWIPQLPPADTAHPVFNYEVPQQTLFYTYSSLPLRPLALGKETLVLPFQNYVKIGGGNLSTLFLDAGIGSITGKDYETAIHIHHLSQKGTIADQQSAMSGVEADALFHKGTNDWHAGIAAERNQYNLFGGDQAVHLAADSLKQVYTTIRATADVKNKQDSNTVFNYDPGISASFYNAKLNASEITLGINAPATYKLTDDIDAAATLMGAFTNYQANGISTANNFIELLPGFNFHTQAVSGHALLGLAEGKGSQGYLLPDLQVGYTIPDTKFVVSGGWQALLHQNTYEQLTTENPYLYVRDSIMQTRSDEVFADLKGASGDHLSYSARISWWNFNNLPTFLNDLGDQKQFYIDYMNVKAISLKLAMRYHVANTWSVGASGDFYNFYGETEKYVWELPSMKIKGDLTITPVPKLTFTAYLALLGGIHAKDANHNAVNLSTIAELGGSAEYQIIPRLSAFAQINNLLSDKYQLYYGYPVYGLNIYGGIRLKF